jgi:hypothetical protein
VSDITVFDCQLNTIEVPCEASLCDVLQLLEAYTTNMVNELSEMTSVVIEPGNCIGLESGTYGIQQVIDAIDLKLCVPCPLYGLIEPAGKGELTVNVYGGLPPYSYQWSIADNVGGIEIFGSSTDETVTVVEKAGLFPDFGLVKVVVSDDAGCSVNDTFLYYFPREPL